METILTPVLLLSIMGGAFALIIGVVSKLTYIPVDEKVAQIREALPGANCGACGYPGCDGCAVAIAKGEAPVNACPVGGEKSATAIAAIVGGDGDAGQKMVASVFCQGSCEKTSENFTYQGEADCRIRAKQFGGGKSCTYGCLGGGTCMAACEFDAIRIVDGLAVIDEEKCVSCMKCIGVCPKHIIELVPYHAVAQVKCKNPEFGREVTSACKIGCMGCGLCARMAPDEFALEGKLAHPTYHVGYDIEKAKLAAEKCPTKAIVFNENGDVNAVIPEEEKETAEA